LPENLIKKRIGKILIVSPGGRRFDINLRDGHLYITERGVFDSALRGLAVQNGASLIEGEFTGFEKTNGTFLSRLKRKSDGEMISVRSDYIIASDGIAFSAGKSCSVKQPCHLYTISSTMRRLEGDACEFWFGNSHASNYYSWIFPSNGNASIGTGGGNPKDLNGLLDNFTKRRFGSSMKSLLEADLIDPPKVYPVPSWRGGPYSSGNILFLGDAAGMVMPTTYEGIYYAMKSGQFAATAVIEGRPDNYRRLLEDRFKYRFLVMSIFRRLFFRSDRTIEKWIRIHGSPSVQEVAMKLWLQKESGSQNLFSYLKAFAGGITS
jgi:geranylgeranyl reductase